MNYSSLRDATDIIEIGRSLSPLERQILIKLAEQGPGLLLEVAVSVFKFPEDVRQPLAALANKGLLTTSSFAGGEFGGELFDLSERGLQLVRLLRDPAMQAELAATNQESQPISKPDLRQHELDLLKKLGDAALEKGDAEQASNYYKQALELTRSLALHS